jgi:hypothetical protein
MAAARPAEAHGTLFVGLGDASGAGRRGEEATMAFAVGYSLDEARLLMTLAASAYVDETVLPGESIPDQAARMRRDIDTSLSQSAYKAWQVVWGPALAGDRGNMMYVAGNAATNQYAVAVRGTDWSFWLD